MLGTLGFESVIGNIVRLSMSGGVDSVFSKTSLTARFRELLRDIQPDVPQPSALKTALVSRNEDVLPLLTLFKEESILDDFEEVFDEGKAGSQELLEAAVRESLDQMHEVWPEFGHVLDIVIHTLFLASSKHAGGGSTSAAIGCIWADWRLHWNEWDRLEFLVHEATHNLVFIDELCHTHYASYEEMAQAEAFAPSAILHTMRPLDKVLHSIVVSAEVLLFRERLIGHSHATHLHPPTEIMLPQALAAIDFIHQTPRVRALLTRRGLHLLGLSQRTFEGLSCAPV